MTSASRSAQCSRNKPDVDYVSYELTRSVCPECRRVIDAQIILGDNKVFMRKRCTEHVLRTEETRGRSAGG